MKSVSTSMEDIINSVSTLSIPAVFKKDKFNLHQVGVYDDIETQVYMNNDKDFAFLYPQKSFNYFKYLPRASQLKLKSYKKKFSFFEDRFSKISPFLDADVTSVLEIGAGDCSLLSLIQEEHSGIRLGAVEIDKNTEQLRKKVVGKRSFKDLDQAYRFNEKYDVICLFHVLEHIMEPYSFLMKISRLMNPSAVLIIEVPSLFDPLIYLYNCKNYQDFYFQLQHPYVYSHKSLDRLMLDNNFQTKDIISYQRYGMENHLNWLSNGKPGGNDYFFKLFTKTNTEYIAELEAEAKTDTVMWIGKVK